MRAEEKEAELGGEGKKRQVFNYPKQKPLTEGEMERGPPKNFLLWMVVAVGWVCSISHLSLLPFCLPSFTTKEKALMTKPLQ